MKRKLLHIVMLMMAATLCVGTPSCRSAKKSDSSRYENVKGGYRKGRPKKGKKGNGNKEVLKSDNRVVKEAYSWMGTPYAFGKAEKGVACDCSGLVYAVYEKAAGIKLPRVSAKQKEFCKPLKKKDVQVGDLCFFATGKDPDKISHVGIMVGDDNFIHASSTKGVIVSDITQPFWVRTFKGYGRVPGQKD